jgi:molybdate transport system substrate-binding protein
MNQVYRLLVAGFATLVGLSVGGFAGAAEIKVLSALSIKGILDDLAPKFEGTSGHKLVISYGALGTVMKRIQDGETADVVILPRQGIDTLVKESKAAAGDVTDIAQSNMGVAVRKGAPKPDVSTPDAFKRTLLAAKSVVYANPDGGGPSGIHMGKVMQQLGIVNEMKPKTVYANTTDFGALMASGKAEMALYQLQNLVQEPGIEVVGPLPGNLQETTVFAATAMAGAKDGAAARALITFLRTPEAASVMKAKGLDAM